MFKIFEPRAMMVRAFITPSPERDRGNGPETWAGIELSGEGCNSKPPRTSGTFAIHGGEEVRPILFKPSS